MYNVLIVFASVTTANRVKSVIEKRFGIRSEVIRAPSALSVEGCSYALRIADTHMDFVWNIISESGLSSKGVFREDDLTRLKQRC